MVETLKENHLSPHKKRPLIMGDIRAETSILLPLNPYWLLFLRQIWHTCLALPFYIVLNSLKPSWLLFRLFQQSTVRCENILVLLLLSHLMPLLSPPELAVPPSSLNGAAVNHFATVRSRFGCVHWEAAEPASVVWLLDLGSGALSRLSQLIGPTNFPHHR